jgi:predicted lipoprotein
MLDDRAMAGMRGRLCNVTPLLVTALVMAISGCAATQNPPPPINVAPQAAIASDEAAGPERGVSGVWEGVSVSNCEDDPADFGRCHAEQKITLTMFQSDNTVTGFYHCAYGNQVCRHMLETGTIRAGKFEHTRLMMRVMHEDGSMCFFTGRPANNEFSGGYECLQGGGIIEQGVFQTRRNY